MYRFLIRAILAVFFMSIITACGEGDTGIIPIDPSDDSKIQLETEAEVTSDKDDTDDSSGSDSGVSNTTSGDSGSKTVSSGQGFKSNGNAALEVSGSSISRGGDVKPPPTVPPTVPANCASNRTRRTPRARLPFAIIRQGWKTCQIITPHPLSRANQPF